ncbi:MAG: hypothetical protein JSW45_10795 [Thiotrichales bacterium]|nr:MAG: hypothetical protein JSW45_10795 [Thiotrichales bacterium]
MKHSILISATTAAIAISIAGCGSSGGDVAGIGGSGITPVGFTSSGTITGFGSIFVNGVEYETDSATFSIDDDPTLTTEDRLATGMRVVVEGEVNSDGVTGTATRVTFDDQLQGPVNAASVVDADGTGRTITVLGTTVQLNSTSTIFDISGTATGPFDFDTIAIDDNVEISGFPDSAGVLQATRIELKQNTFVPDSSIVELKGPIVGLSGTDFSVNGVNVNAVSAAIDDLPGGLVENALVDVKGTCSDACCNPINATRVEGQTPGFDDNFEVELEGVITRYVDDSDFDVDGFPVDASGAGVERIPSSLTLAIDKEVEVEGTVVSGKLIATKVKDEGGSLKVSATVTNVDIAGSSFEVTPITGQTITVKLDTSSQVEDETGTASNPSELLNSLQANTDFVSVEGYDDGTGTNTIIANKVEREPADDVIIQGVITAGTATSNNVTVLGVTIPYDISGGGNDTDFENENDVSYPSATEFFDDVTLGTTLVKVKDKEPGGGANAIGVADEIEIELP